MSLMILHGEIRSLQIDEQGDDPPTPEERQERIANIRQLIHKSPQWIQKNEHCKHKMLKELGTGGRGIHWAAGALDEALRIDAEERGKGVPKPIDKTPEPWDPDLLEESINLENWLMFHGEGQIGPSWWMDNQKKEEDSWQSHEIPQLNKALQRKDGMLVNQHYVFRFVGKGSFDRGEWTVNGGHEYLFGVFELSNDPKRLEVEEETLDIDLGRWLDAYGPQEYPARMMCPVESKSEQMKLNKRLKALDGAPVGANHVWRYVGKKTYKREGKVDLFKCEGTF